MARHLTHYGQHPLTQFRFSDLLARQLGVNADHVDHVSAKDREMLVGERFHTSSVTFHSSHSLRRAKHRLAAKRRSCVPPRIGESEDHRLTLHSPQGRVIGMRVLIVEDDSSVAQSLELMLKSERFNPYITDLGHEAVELAKIYDYDIILLDLNLPDMSGYDVLRSLRIGKVKTPVLILSGFAGIKDKVRG